MNLFADYIQPLTNWLHFHPHWCLFITFLVSLSESLAIVGAIIPGSVTMTAIGILAGSGVIRTDLTLIAAILGAIAGDSLSYAIGYFYSEKILYVWPFNKYPTWIAYGKEFFVRHGGKSVLLGRFIGPLRAIIPIIAGIMHMKQGRFLIANVLSAIGWSLLYVMPGVFIGAASSELSAESATRLFVIILIVLVSIWFLSIFLKFLFTRINSYLKNNLHGFWLTLKKHPILYQIFQFITPKKEKNHYMTVMLLATAAFAFFCFFLLLLLHIQVDWISEFNLPLHHVLQSFQSRTLQSFFIFCTQLTSAFTLICLFFLCLLYFLWKKNARTLLYLSSIIGFTALIAFLSIKLISSPPPQGLIGSKTGSSFPAMDIALATAFYCFIYFYITTHYHFLTQILRHVLFIVLGLSGLGALYLGDYWFTDVLGGYCLGIMICFLHCLIYRKSETIQTKKATPPLLFFSLIGFLMVFAGLSTSLQLKSLIRNHSVSQQEYYLSQTQWWDQNTTILPVFVPNRLGKPLALINIQYSGELDDLENHLLKNNWQSHDESFFTRLMQQVNSKSDTIKLPLLEILFKNKKPQLLMTFKDETSALILELRIWESSYYLKESNNPIWIGNIRFNKQNKLKKLTDPLIYLSFLQEGFKLKKITFKSKLPKSNKMHFTSNILLVSPKESLP